METYNEDYFENGVEKHISGYTDYKWKPEYVMPLANWISYNYSGSVLDYGCAKGFLVKALRMFNMEAHGYDISNYAIEHCEPEVKDYVTDIWEFPDNSFELTIAKDVLEHIPKEELPKVLKEIARVTNSLLVIVPLGDNGKFRIREYELDVTHVTKEDEVFWIKLFNDAGFDLYEFHYSIDGIKDNWTKNFPYGNGIFRLEKR